MRLHATFAALEERDFRLFYAGLVVSLVGTWMERAALQWLVYRLTGNSEVWLGLVVGVPLIPALLVSLPAGIVIDRVRVRRVLLLTQTLACVGAAVFATLVLTGHVTPWGIVAYAAYSSGVFAIDAPARQAFVARVVGPLRITNAVALSAVAFQAAQVGGSALFGWLFAHTPLGEGGCIALNAASFAAIIVSLFAIRERPVDLAGGRVAPNPLDGLRLAWRAPVLRAALLTAVCTSLLGYQVNQLLPVYAKKVWTDDTAALVRAAAGSPAPAPSADASPAPAAAASSAGAALARAVEEKDAEQFANMRVAVAIGALLGGLVLASRGPALRRGKLVARRAILVPPVLLAFSLIPWYGAGLALLGAAGFLMIQTHSSCSSILQTHVPDELRGRVASLFTLAVLASFPLGGFLAGQIAAQLGARATTSIAAIALAAAYAAIHATHREFRAAT